MDTPSLLQFVEDGNTGWADVLRWFQQAGEAQATTIGDRNSLGETALHIILKHNIGGSQTQYQQQQHVAVVNKFREIDKDLFKIQDSRGRLPLHNACHERACSFKVIKAVIEAYPAGLGVLCNEETNDLTHSPFGWDYSATVGGHFTDFLLYVAASDVDGQTRESQHRVIGHCKNWVPLDLLKEGMLNEKSLESTGIIRWLNEMPCKRRVVCSMVFELYLHMAWIGAYIHATILHIEEDKQFLGWEPKALLVFAACFCIQEFSQLYRFVITKAGIAYALDFWNWIDLITIGLVTASAVTFLQNGDNKYLFICTGFFQFLLLVSYLKKTFFHFAAFVSGILKIFRSLVPFLVISFITLFAFSYMYYVREEDHSPTYDPYYRNATNPYATFMESTRTVCSSFASAPQGYYRLLDVLFGFSIGIVLLNVVIAVVSDAWAAAMSEAKESFWKYRLDLILEKTRGIDEENFFQTALCGCFRGLDSGKWSQRIRRYSAFINTQIRGSLFEDETIGITTDQLGKKLAVAYRKQGPLFCLVILVKSLGFILLGFPTFGFFWPKFFRELLFTPPMPKEDDSKVRMDDLAAEIAECKKLNEKQIAEIAECKKLNEKQIELMQQILLKET